MTHRSRPPGSDRARPLRRRPALRRGPILLAAGLVVAFGGAAALAVSALQEPFPHSAHEGLFPVCQGCHAGIEVDDEAAFYPEPERCVNCHDGVRAVEVTWSGPRRSPSNLRFSHREHGEELAREGGEAACQDCHRPAGATARMMVRPASPDRCVACHGHEELDHPDGGQPCVLCHRPLTDVPELAPARIADFPRPSSHERDDFVSTHGPDIGAVETVCATCHARPSCERCHVDAGAVPAIQALAPDSRVRALLVDRPAEYPVPGSHETGSWIRVHGPEAAADPAGCATCHARPGCLTCHAEGTEAVAALFDPRPGGPAGVVIDREEARARLHAPDFALGHGSEAATGSADCASCHAEAFCTECHDGAGTPSFHPPNFMETHGAPAFGAGVECATCHNPELFCRSCHAEAGLASTGRLNAGFHDAQPFWLLGHGQAARQNLEACVTCHGQTDCASCHSPLGGWGVSPHGPGFDASRFRERATTGCILCHRGGIPPS